MATQLEAYSLTFFIKTSYFLFLPLASRARLMLFSLFVFIKIILYNEVYYETLRANQKNS